MKAREIRGIRERGELRDWERRIVRNRE